jgi:heme exporter protein A
LKLSREAIDIISGRFEQCARLIDKFDWAGYRTIVVGGSHADQEIRMRLRASQIAIERGGRRLFSDLSFEIDSGDALIVVGPNGAGKTSLLRAIAGLLRLAGGALSHEGGDNDASLGEQAHYLAHADALRGALTARENLEFWAQMLAPGPSPNPLPQAGEGARRALHHDAGISRADEEALLPLAGESGRPKAGRMSVPAALERLGLGHVLDFPVHALSAGQKRRVALARLLVAYRPLWLLDEPLTALDDAAQRRFGEIMRAHLAGGGLIVAATHAPIDLPGARQLRLDAAALSS